ncbi:acetyl-CoA carboxylase, carboxyltransferase subunit beta [Clostridium sp.]|uniref:acetyl-CoA carboxylase, carboxyltransferase subunit beta n=1 Tax=Clostridium sp. TaxID=1506 RepID=UPI003217E65E
MKELKSLFKKNVYIEIKPTKDQEAAKKPKVPDGMWVRCSGCGKTIYRGDLESNLKVCYSCGGHFRLTAKERIKQIIDEGSFTEWFSDISSVNPLDFPDYDEKIRLVKEKTDMNDAVITGCGNICGKKVIICVMDSNFLMGSMGSVVGEKITRSVEKATHEKLPIIIFTCSGGARMQEGILSLMQMAKTSAALSYHNNEGLLYITVLTDPTTGGVTASFAMLGDIILAEPNTLIGFAGRRVIEQTIRQKLPEDFQRAEFLLEKGYIDKIVHRKAMKSTLSTILELHNS